MQNVMFRGDPETAVTKILKLSPAARLSGLPGVVAVSVVVTDRPPKPEMLFELVQLVSFGLVLVQWRTSTVADVPLLSQ